MSKHEEAGELVAEVTRFALEMTELLRGVLPAFASPFPSTVSGTHVIVRQQPADGVILTADGWDGVIRTGRRRWREKQLRSAVRDDPQTAAEVLMRLGYGVIEPPEPPRLRTERIDAL